MPKFRKTALIDAVQWTGDNWAALKAFAAGSGIHTDAHYPGQVRLRTREGLTDFLPAGYWVATDGVSFWPIADDFMQANYEEVE